MTIDHLFEASALLCDRLESEARPRIKPDLLPVAAPGRVRDPKLQKKLSAVNLYEQYKRDLNNLKLATKKYQTMALLKERFPVLVLWNAIEKSDENDIVKGEFTPGIFAWSLVKRRLGLKGAGDRTLHNYRKALRDAHLLADLEPPGVKTPVSSGVD